MCDSINQTDTMDFSNNAYCQTDPLIGRTSIMTQTDFQEPKQSIFQKRMSMIGQMALSIPTHMPVVSTNKDSSLEVKEEEDEEDESSNGKESDKKSVNNDDPPKLSKFVNEPYLTKVVIPEIEKFIEQTMKEKEDKVGRTAKNLKTSTSLIKNRSLEIENQAKATKEDPKDRQTSSKREADQEENNKDEDTPRLDTNSAIASQLTTLIESFKQVCRERDNLRQMVQKYTKRPSRFGTVDFRENLDRSNSGYHK